MLNEVLKLVRQYHRLNQKEAAKQLDISASYLCELENGKKEASLKILEKYETVFDLPGSSLLFMAESIDNKKKKAVADKAVKILKWFAA